MTTTKGELFDILKSVRIVPFLLITACYVTWGFTNDIIGVTVSAFEHIFNLNALEGTYVNIANALGYFTLSIPAAVYMMRYTYKSGVLFSLGIYALGIAMLLPAKYHGEFYGFLMAYYMMTCGTAALETCCHPLVYHMGDERRGIFRLNLAQTFNSLGAVVGMYVATAFVKKGLSPMPIEQRIQLPKAQADVLKTHDLNVVTEPYMYIAAALLVLIVLIRVTKMPAAYDERSSKGPLTAFRELLHVKNYRNGLMAEFFYIGAQICCLTFITTYTRMVLTAEDMFAADVEMMVSKVNLIAIMTFATMRLVCTLIILYVKPGRLLIMMGAIALMTTVGAIVFNDRNGIWCLIITCGAMSMMFPTIYGMALRGMDSNIKYASAGLTMTVSAGAVFPTLQATVIDMNISFLGLSAVNLSFIVPMICFIIVTVYGHTGYVRHNITHDYVS